MRLAAGLVLAGLACAPAVADELPERAAGLWEQTSTGPDGRITVRQCVGPGTDAAAMAAMGMQNCSKKTVTRTADGYATEAECQLGAVVASARGTVTGDFATFVRTETESTVTGVPGQSAATPRKTVIEARRLGDCEAGQSPGDVVLPDGKVIRTPGAK